MNDMSQVKLKPVDALLVWSVEGFNYRAQGKRRVYWIKTEPVGINRFRPAIQRGAVTFYCDCPFHLLDDAKHFCQSDSDSINEIIDESTSTLQSQLTQAHKERDEAVARLKEAEWLINNSFRVGSINRAMAKEWLTRRDAWLKGGAK